MNLLVIPSGTARAAYRYLWLRTVRGFDERHHCQRCLKGHHLRRVGLDALDGGGRRLVGRLTRVELATSDPYVYLCAGATGRDGYDRNVHIALREAPGRVVEVRGYDGTVFRVEGAERLRIPDLPDGWQGLPPAFTRCRNFRFGVAAFGCGLAPPERLLGFDD